MVCDHELLLELLPCEVDFVKEVLRKLLTRAAAVVPLLILAPAQPAPLEGAVAALRKQESTTPLSTRTRPHDGRGSRRPRRIGTPRTVI